MNICNEMCELLPLKLAKFNSSIQEKKKRESKV
jgi:hypothetical protein